MFEIHKRTVVDENQKPVAVQIPFDEFQRIEEVIENFGLAKLMVETEYVNGSLAMRQRTITNR